MRSMKFRFWDGLAILLSVAVILLFSFAQYGKSRETGVLEIKSMNGVEVYALSENREISVSGPLGETVIHIEEGVVHVTDSPCRDKLCVLAGNLSGPGDWTACMPNGIFIRITGTPEESEVDETSY
mgnify:CR=1 FL=1